MFVTSSGNLNVYGDIHLHELQGDTNASAIRFYEPPGNGNRYTSFKAQAQSNNIVYTLPSADGSNGYLLSTNGSGSLSWSPPSAASISIGSVITGSTNNKILFSSNSGALNENANLTFDATTFGAPQSIFTTSSASSVPVIAKGASAQSAALQQWQNSTGTVLANVNQDGLFTTAGLLSSSSQSFFGTTSTNGLVAGNVPLSVSGASGQSADIQQWKNYDGTVLSRIKSTGALQHGAFTLPLTDGSANQILQTNGSGTVFWAASSGGMTVGNAVSGGSANAILYEDGSQNLAASSSMTFDGTTAVFPKLQVTNATAANNAVIVKGAASQTGALTQWQNSSGTVLTQIASGGDFLASAATIVPLAVRGATSQSGALTTWRNNNGTVLTQLDSNGEFLASAATIIPLSAKAAGSQSAAIQTWKNNNGTVLTQVDKDGMFLSSAATIIPLAVKGASGQTAALQTWRNNGGTILTQIASGGDFLASASTIVPMVIRGAASQTADLQQWKNSNGTTLLKITSTGSLAFNGSTSGTVTIGAAAAAGTWTATLPTTDGNNGDFLQTDGAGVISWTQPKKEQTTNAVTLTNSTAETTMWSYSLSGNSIGSNGVVKIRISGDGVNSGSARTLTIRFKIGATTLASQTESIGAATTYNWSCDIDIYATTTSTQKTFMKCILVEAAAIPNVENLWAYSSSSEDMTTSKTLDFTMQMGTASASFSMIKEMSLLEVFP